MEETYYIFTHGSLARKDNTLRFISEDGKNGIFRLRIFQIFTFFGNESEYQLVKFTV